MPNKVISVNRKARHDYYVLDAIEAGVSLVGTEVKSIRNGSINMKDAWVDIKNGEMYMLGVHISPYEKGNIFNRDPIRERKLLVHKKEIYKYSQELKLQGTTLVPLSMYFKGSKVKVEVGLCKGKKLYDKRQSEAQKDAKREIDRAMKMR